MPTLKSLLDATVKAGSKFSLINSSASAVTISVPAGTYTGSTQTKYIAPSDGFLALRGGQTANQRSTEIIIYGSVQARLTSENFVTNLGDSAIYVPVRKGNTYALLCRTYAGTAYFYANES